MKVLCILYDDPGIFDSEEFVNAEDQIKIVGSSTVFPSVSSP